MVQLGILANSHFDIDSRNLENIELTNFYGYVSGSEKPITNIEAIKNKPDIDHDVLLGLITNITNTIKPNIYNYIGDNYEEPRYFQQTNLIVVKLELHSNGNRKYSTNEDKKNGVLLIDSQKRTKFIKIKVENNIVTFLYYNKPLEMGNLGKFIEKVIDTILTTKTHGGKRRRNTRRRYSRREKI
jgi:hypothetical protein